MMLSRKLNSVPEMTRQRLSKKSTDFNRPIHYPRVAF
jgi:hypothetical protein